MGSVDYNRSLLDRIFSPMYVIEIVIKSTPMPMSVQRKTVEDANSVYQQVLSAVRSGGNSLLELTCERQPEKTNRRYDRRSRRRANVRKIRYGFFW